MCFDTRISGRSPKPQCLIADRDIIVYKVLTDENQGPYYSLYIARRKQPWEEGYIYHQSKNFTMKTDIFGLRWNVHGNAFHSFISKALCHGGYFKHGYNIKTMVVPKGAKYLRNSHEIVSDKLWYPTKEELKKVRKRLGKMKKK